MLEPEFPQGLRHRVFQLRVIQIIRRIVQRRLSHETGDILILLRLFHGGEIGGRGLEGQPAKAVLIVLHPCVSAVPAHIQRLAGFHLGRVILGHQIALHIAGGDAIVAEHQRRGSGVVDIVTGLGAVQKRQGEVAARNGQDILLIGDVGGQIEQDVLLGPLVIEVYLPLVFLIAAQLLLQKTTNIIRDVRIVVIGKAVIGRLRVEKGVGLLRLLQQCRSKPLVLGDDIVAGVEAVRPLSPQAAGQQGAVADLRRVQHIAVHQQLIGRIEILPRCADVLHRHGVVIAQRVRHTGLRRCGQLALGVKPVLMQPVEGIRVLAEGLAIQCAPAAVGIRLAHEAPEIVRGRLGHGDLQHGVLGDLPGADFGHIALRKSRVAAVAQCIHLLRRPIRGSVHHGRAGGILIPAAQHRHTYQQHRRQPSPCPQRGGRILLSSAEMRRVQKEYC